MVYTYMPKVQTQFAANYCQVACSNDYKKGGCNIPADIPDGCLTDYNNYANIKYVLKIVDDKITDEYLTRDIYEKVVKAARDRADYIRDIVYPELAEKWTEDRIAFEIMASSRQGTLDAYLTNIITWTMQKGDKLLKVNSVVLHKNQTIEELLAEFKLD